MSDSNISHFKNNDVHSLRFVKTFLFIWSMPTASDFSHKWLPIILLSLSPFTKCQNPAVWITIWFGNNDLKTYVSSWRQTGRWHRGFCFVWKGVDRESYSTNDNPSLNDIIICISFHGKCGFWSSQKARTPTEAAAASLTVEKHCFSLWSLVFHKRISIFGGHVSPRIKLRVAMEAKSQGWLCFKASGPLIEF